ncbi:heterokaryon incompatibility protein-domain-containing protein [Podospora aff. communis PSN243]|uniref:Heterokaryon incompatibility protein-domain-containing protein n=1 Tax=Podospora aff. communis PSN243 TaxID=3040156 RepID=A0AAV9GE85_9PEZI|nr:heterokaryon incompatibility protein-domain-containing protein [Podospora aff. communis PSN243]
MGKRDLFKTFVVPMAVASAKDKTLCIQPIPDVPGKRYIRLLHLLGRGKQEVEDISCTLSVVDVDAALDDYDALSYVWGEDRQPEARIQVNGQKFKITSGLHCALIKLRRSFHTRTLWVDSICINQNDVGEKAKQVALMADIYRNAAQTVVWLGKGAEDSLSAIHRIKFLSCVRSDLARDKEIDSDNLDTANGVGPSAEFQQAIMAVTDHQWWKRVWTAQEIVLAKKATIHQGSQELRWAEFESVIELGMRVFWKDNEVSWGRIRTDANAVSPVKQYRLLKSLRNPPAELNNPADLLLYFLFQTRSRMSTDPRDKIFSLLGLLSPNDVKVLGIEPDYTRSEKDVYTAAARNIILVSDNLDILGACTSPSHARIPSLPSWMPDWGYRRDPSSSSECLVSPMTEDAKGARRTTHASGGAATNMSWEDGGDTLVAEGHCVDVISQVSCAADFQPDPISPATPTSGNSVDENNDQTKSGFFGNPVGFFYEAHDGFSFRKPHKTVAFVRESARRFVTQEFSACFE